MAVLIVRAVGEPSYRIPLTSTKVRIGRSKENEICLAGDAAVSRFHAEISMVGEQYFVVDLGSHRPHRPR